MSNLLNASEHFERTLRQEPVRGSLLSSFALHAALAGLLLSYAFLRGLFPHHVVGEGGVGQTISVQLVSNALPLPADRQPNQNVLATDTPSEAPAPQTKAAKTTEDKSAIPIPLHEKVQKKQAEKQQETKLIRQQAPPKVDNRAQYGEQASSQVDRGATAAGTTIGHSTVTSSSGQGFNFPWYVDGINRKITQNTYRGEVDPRTPVGTRSYMLFTIRRDGTVTDIKLDKSSGSPTLDRACLRAAQRVDTFGPLPSPAQNGPLIVSYYCEY